MRRNSQTQHHNSAPAHYITKNNTQRRARKNARPFSESPPPPPPTLAARNEELGDWNFVDRLTAWATLLLEFDKYQVIAYPSVTEGTIILASKNGDTMCLKQYRPLLITNSAYKLLTGIINNRLIGTMAEVIRKHQTGFMPGRLMS